MKKFLKKFNRRTVVTTTLMLVIFVMSLGYAALSQFIEIEGVALIDRTWNIKVTNVTSSVEGEGINVSNPYVGSTVTMNAKIPTSTSKVTYTITLKNEGNIRAKLHSIEKVVDKNTNITYTISGVEEGTTLLEPGNTNTVTVVINYASGVTSASNIEKRLMLSFNYIEDTTSNGPGGTVVTYDEYSLGDAVTLVDGSKWTVVENSNSTQEYITLWAHNTYGDSYAFDTTGSTMYDPTSTTNIGYVVSNTILPTIKTNLSSKGGDVAGLTARLMTKEELDNILSVLSITDESNALVAPFTQPTWLMTEYNNVNVYNYLSGSSISQSIATDMGYVRPVIVVKKSNILKPLLVYKILANSTAYADNVSSPYVSASTGINFSAISSDTNGKGLYYTSTNTEGNQPTYYFRGAVENNYVQFGVYKAGTTVNGTTYNVDTPIYWKIIRINEDGSIRLIYNGTSTTATGANVTIGNSPFNTNKYDNAYVGYMYGTTGSSTYALTHANTNNSTIKGVIDNWYSNNTNLSSLRETHLADAGFCNDRSVASTSGTWYSNDTALGYAKNVTYYGAYNRLSTNKSPQFACPNASNDLFTTSTSSKGNKALTVPIGLITADEVWYAGATTSTNQTHYLYTGANYWTMSPGDFNGSSAMGWPVSLYGNLNGVSVNPGLGVRPVANLQSGVEIINGDGTSGNPYVIK